MCLAAAFPTAVCPELSLETPNVGILRVFFFVTDSFLCLMISGPSPGQSDSPRLEVVLSRPSHAQILLSLPLFPQGKMLSSSDHAVFLSYERERTWMNF